MSEEQVIQVSREEVEQMKKEAKRMVALGESLEKLLKNKDFIRLIQDSYLKDEPVRLVGLLGDSSVNMNEKRDLQRNDIQERLIGIARLAEYFRNVTGMKSFALRQLQELDQLEDSDNISYN